MEDVLRFLEAYEVWIYALVGITGAIYIRKLLLAWEEWRNSVFGLERDSAQRRFSAAMSMLVILALFAISEFILVSFVSPVYPKTNLLPTPTVAVLVTPTATLPALATPDALAATIAPTTTAEQGCTPGEVEWLDPQPGQEISGTMELKGTVNIPDLGFYKYEYSQPGSTIWTPIAADTKPKNAEVIGVWNTSIVVPGDYLLRLVVSNSQNQLLPYCVVPVRIKAP